MVDKENYLNDSYTVWKLLEEHFQKIKKVHLRQLFMENPRRAEQLSVEDSGIYFDYSKNRVTSETMELLFKLAKQADLTHHIEAMFRGERVNTTEDRAALHIALRTPESSPIWLDGEDVVIKVHQELVKMARFARQVGQGQWLGFTGKPIRNVINIGIGGSDLGPEMAYEALRYYSIRNIRFAFISNVDATDFKETVEGLDPVRNVIDLLVC
ncbi:MAG TPA: glucose-6-phosphate isomerase, partial [Atribacterota bacterium]|nr:glucose-6-phosphate isomerase [Atribacterota bacterium]